MTQPEAGWYDDPSNPGLLRYWDGAAWTEHLAAKHATSAGAGLGRRPVGDLLGATFRLAVERVGDLLPLVVVFVVVPAVLVTAASWSALRDLVIVDEEVIGWEASSLASLVPAGVVYFLGLVMFQLAITDQAVGAAVEIERAWPTSILAAVRALARTIAWALLFVAAFVAAVLVSVVLVVISPLLLILVIPAAIAVGVVLWVKLAFFAQSLIARPTARNPVTDSFGVSAGWFWGAFGRLALFALIGWALSFIMNLALIPFDVSGQLETNDDGAIDRFVFTDLFPNVGVLAVVIVLGGIVQAASQIITAFGTSIVYVDHHGADAVRDVERFCLLRR